MLFNIGIMHLKKQIATINRLKLNLIIFKDYAKNSRSYEFFSH